jgi:tetratricopeptide (TPR) repeat protein
VVCCQNLARKEEAMIDSFTVIARRWPRLAGWLPDILVALGAALVVASVLGITYLNSSNWPTGGDSASHLLYAWLYSEELLFSGQIVPWVPEVFGGMPFLSYYFPLPFIVIAVLSKSLGVASAFKWGSFLACMLLPGAVFTASRRWLNFSWYAAFFAALGALAFLLHEQNSIWGGNLLSGLAGEFAYSYGVLFGVLAMMAWTRAINLGRGWLLAALMEAASGFSHGFPLLIVGFSSAFLLLDGLASGNVQRFKAALSLLVRGHLLAFALLGGWLWPMLEMHSLTIPNDASFTIESWRDLLPAALWPCLIGGLFGLALLAFPSVRRGWDHGQRRAVSYFISAAGLAAVAFIAGDQIGLPDIRFFPLVWLLAAIACGWLLGQALAAFGANPNAVANMRNALVPTLSRVLVVAAAGFGMFGWLGQHVQLAPDWGLWNHSGLESKPQWHNLSKLFPAMSGDLWSPRLAFEHDPANNDIGSTRALEALPMFLKHRPVLEGLYMESALIGPAVYQVQSEISARPSSPLVRFPSGSLDPQLAAEHLAFLHADTILLRSEEAKAAIEASGLFNRVAEAAPFALYRLNHFDSQLIEVVTQAMLSRPAEDWMQDAFAWFRTRSRFDAYLPVYGNGRSGSGFVPTDTEAPSTTQAIRGMSFSRNELIFETEAIGKAHLIKFAYHPRWQLKTQGTLQIAGPGFMLVIPEESEIRLEYGHTMIGKLGIAATLIALLVSAFLIWTRWPQPVAAPMIPDVGVTGVRYWLPLLAGWALMIGVGLYFNAQSPERFYSQAWLAMNTGKHADAAQHFLRAYELRRPPAKKEEALFWLAKSLELSGQRAEARARYRELIDGYHGYWLPESLYTYILLGQLDGAGAEIEPFITRLREEYPNNAWARKLDAN